MSEVTAKFTMTPISATIVVDKKTINFTPSDVAMNIYTGSASGFSGYSGQPGGTSGYSGFSGYSGISGDPGGTSGYSGVAGAVGADGPQGISGYSGFSGVSGSSTSGFSGYSGVNGVLGGSGYSGFSGTSGYSGTSGFSGAGYLDLPQNLQPTTYNVVLADSGKHLFHASGSATGTYVFPANSNVAFPIGSIVSILNLSANTVAANLTTDSLKLIGSGVTGNRTVGANGAATLIKVANTTWAIMGTNIT